MSARKKVAPAADPVRPPSGGDGPVSPADVLRPSLPPKSAQDPKSVVTAAPTPSSATCLIETAAADFALSADAGATVPDFELVEPANHARERPVRFRKGVRVFWRDQTATVANEVIDDWDILIKFEGGEVLTVTQSALLSQQGAGFYGYDVAPRDADDVKTPASKKISSLGDVLTKEKLKAWQMAKANVDAVEAQTLGKRAAQGKHAQKASLFLDRLRSKKYAERVSDAWFIIAEHEKKADGGQRADNGQRVVRCLLDALTLSENATQLSDDYYQNMDGLKKLKNCADQLYEYFTDTVERDPDWKIVAGAAELWSHAVERDPDRKSVARGYLNATPRFKSRMIQPLRRIQLFLTNRMAKFAYIIDQIDLTREIKAPVAKRVIFTMAMSNSMQSIFGRGRWLDDAVALLTEVAFEKVIESEKVKRARKDATSRRKKRPRRKKRSH